MRKTALAGALALLLTCPAPGHAATVGVVFQISTTKASSWKVAVRNIRNLEMAGTNGHHIEVVVLGPAIRILLKDSPVARNLKALYASGVTIDACEAAILRAKLKPGVILPFVHYVRSGVAEVVHRERQGWAYVRP